MHKQICRGSLLAGWCLLILSLIIVSRVVLAKTPVGPWQTDVVDPTDCWYPSLALDSAGRPYISYGAGGELKYARQNGSDWQLEFVEEQPGATGWYSSLALDSSDSAHISYYSPYSATLMYARYISDSWQIETVGNTYEMGGQTSLALDSSGRPHIAYWDYTHQMVGYAHDDGSDWQLDSVTTMTTGGQGASLALALDSSDHPHLCYYDYDAGTLNYATHNGTTWQVDTVDDVSYNGQHCSVAIDSSDHPHISYRDLGLLYAYHSGAAWQITTVDDDFFAGSSSSLTLDNRDMPHIGYSDWAVPDHDLRYAHFDHHNWWVEVVEVAGEDRRFEIVSQALDAAKRPHIVYCDVGTTTTLKYAVRDAAPTLKRVYLPLVVR